MYFDWDDEKTEINRTKHGVSFAEAATAFQDPNALEQFDAVHSDDEERWILVGMSARRRVLIVVFVERVDDCLRIISARKAIKAEMDSYFSRV